MINELKKIPNQLTLLRILIIPLMYFLAINKYTQAFAILFLFAGITDFLDGFLARRLNQESSFGNSFDSVADRIFYVSLIPWFFLFEKEFLLYRLKEVIVFASVIIIFQIFNLCLNKKFVFRHTYLAKFSAIITYILLLFSIFYGLNDFIFYTIITAVIFSNLEEFLLNLKNKNINVKTILT